VSTNSCASPKCKREAQGAAAQLRKLYTLHCGKSAPVLVVSALSLCLGSAGAPQQTTGEQAVSDAQINTPITSAASLDPKLPVQGEPAWMSIARGEIGLEEVRDNAVIVGWAKALGGWIAKYFTNAHTIPWCGLFVDECLTLASCRTPGNKSLGALNWRGWGQALVRGIPGAVLVFQRLGGGHVGFYVGEDADAYHVLGGNQSDSVSITRVAKARCVAIRWPNESTPTGKPLMLAVNGSPLPTKPNQFAPPDVRPVAEGDPPA
jgi:uncharacterized protein (TIGR02594 family)